MVEDRIAGEWFALKRFSPRDENVEALAKSRDADARQMLCKRFLKMALILSELHDEPAVVDVAVIGDTETDTPYYLMPYLPNSLADMLGQDIFDTSAQKEMMPEKRPKNLPWEQASGILEQVLTGLAAAHAKGLVHRDLKPSNVLLRKDRSACLAGFGIAKTLTGQDTRSGLRLGSRNYMAPEQHESTRPVDTRADVYAFGRLAYRTLTGRLPEGRHPPVSKVAGVPRVLDDLINACLSQECEGRPSDARELRRRWREATGGSAPGHSGDRGTAEAMNQTSKLPRDHAQGWPELPTPPPWLAPAREHVEEPLQKGKLDRQNPQGAPGQVQPSRPKAWWAAGELPPWRQAEIGDSEPDHSGDATRAGPMETPQSSEQVPLQKATERQIRHYGKVTDTPTEGRTRETPQPSELALVREYIEKKLLEKGELDAQASQGLDILAVAADLERKRLDQLVAEVEADLGERLKAVRRFVEAVVKTLARDTALNKGSLATLGRAGAANGLEKSQVDALIAWRQQLLRKAWPRRVAEAPGSGPTR